MSSCITHILAALAGLGGSLLAEAADVRFSGYQAQTNRDLLLQLQGETGGNLRVQYTTNLKEWVSLATARQSGATLQHTDSAAPFHPQRAYRALVVETNAITGDFLATDAGEVLLHPMYHASVLLVWSNQAIYFDPTGNVASLAGLPKASVVLYTHDHADHLNTNALALLLQPQTIILAPLAVYNKLNPGQKPQAAVMTNGQTTNLSGLLIEAVPAYNTTASFHAKGAGNGYVISVGSRRIYVAGDTQDTAEMRALPNIDVAFLPVNQPYTLTVSQAVSAVQAFRPKVVYPYHHSGTDVAPIKQQCGPELGVEVRLRKWY
jgi:L-ascorbate metabolism protein UlaG (beta-lactamase superfamily)